jgi:hypothetical protein
VLGVQEVCVEERVEFGVELRVVKVLLLNQVEKTGQGEQRSGPTLIVRVRQEIHQEFGAGEPGLDGVDHNTQKGLSLRLGEVIPKNGQPCVLRPSLVAMDSAKSLIIWVGLCEEVFKVDFVIRARGFVAGREEGNEDLDGVGLSSSRSILTVPN